MIKIIFIIIVILVLVKFNMLIYSYNKETFQTNANNANEINHELNDEWINK